MTGNPSGRPGRLSERSRGIASDCPRGGRRRPALGRHPRPLRARADHRSRGVREPCGERARGRRPAPCGGAQIVVYLVDRGSTDLVAARPLLESVVGAVIQTDPFRRVFRTAASETNRVFFQRERANALFDLGDAAEVVRFGLQSVSPKVARQLPRDLEPDLVTLRRREFAGRAGYCRRGALLWRSAAGARGGGVHPRRSGRSRPPSRCAALRRGRRRGGRVAGDRDARRARAHDRRLKGRGRADGRRRAGRRVPACWTPTSATCSSGRCSWLCSDSCSPPQRLRSTPRTPSSPWRAFAGE